MKNILVATVAFAALSISAFAAEGKIGKIEFYESGSVKVVLILADGSKDNRQLVSTGDVKKSQIAAILTAKSMNYDVELKPGTIDGVSGWKAVNLM